MIKKLLVMLSAVMFMACSTNNELADISNSNIEDENTFTSDELSVINLNAKIDSINNEYASKMVLSRGFGGWVISSKLEKSADHAGKIVGSWIGKKIGCAAGCVIGGNPVTGIGGYVIGRYVGGIAGSAAASYGASLAVLWVLNQQSKCSAPMRLSHETNINTEQKDSLSFGELHNLIMKRLISNKDKYINTDSTLNYGLILDDCVAYAIEYDSANYANQTLNEEKSLLIKQAQVIEECVKQAQKNEKDSEYFYNDVYNRLKGVVDIDKDLYKKLINLDLKVEEAYQNLNEEEALQYEKEIDKAIDEAIVNPELRQEFKTSNSVIASSTQLWKQEEFK